MYSSVLQLVLSLIVVVTSAITFSETRKIVLTVAPVSVPVAPAAPNAPAVATLGRTALTKLSFPDTSTWTVGTKSIVYSAAAAFPLAVLAVCIQSYEIYRTRAANMRYASVSSKPRSVLLGLSGVGCALAFGEIVGLQDLATSGDDEKHRMNAQRAAIGSLVGSAAALGFGIVW